MPGTRPRLTITETDDVAEALDAAAVRWPEVRSRQQLLLRLVEEGRRTLAHEAIRRASGAVTGVYEQRYLNGLRDDWPA
jgi:hypothetical protein